MDRAQTECVSVAAVKKSETLSRSTRNCKFENAAIMRAKKILEINDDGRCSAHSELPSREKRICQMMLQL